MLKKKKEQNEIFAKNNEDFIKKNKDEERQEVICYECTKYYDT